MSLDLSLIPIDEKSEVIIRCHNIIQPLTVLKFKKNFYSIFSQLRLIEGQPKPMVTPQLFPSTIKLTESFGSNGKSVDSNPYDDSPLSFVFARQLYRLDVKSDPFHLAILAYIKALPSEIRIVLFWE